MAILSGFNRLNGNDSANPAFIQGLIAAWQGNGWLRQTPTAVEPRTTLRGSYELTEAGRKFQPQELVIESKHQTVTWRVEGQRVIVQVRANSGKWVE